MEFNETQKGRITREIIPLSNNNILFFFHPSEHREKFSRGNTKFKGTEEEQEKEERKEKQVSPAFSKKPAPATLPHQPPRKKKDKGRTKGSGKKIRRKIRSRIPRPHSQSLSLSLSLGSRGSHREEGVTSNPVFSNTQRGSPLDQETRPDLVFENGFSILLGS